MRLDKKMDNPPSLPRVAVSVGDTMGIGPEVSVAAARSAEVRGCCRPVLYWPRSISGPVPGVECVLVGDGDDPPARSGFESLRAAFDDVRSGKATGLVTAPVSKLRMATEVPGFTGHTDWLADRSETDRDRVLMIFSGQRVVTACVTRHLRLGDVPDVLDPVQVARAALLLWAHLHLDLGVGSPSLSVCGVNPHASDGGLLGDEERSVISPAVRLARRVLEISGGPGEIRGPFAADAAYRDHVLGNVDGVLAMFHDQATIAAKLADPFASVNVSAGLPFVRTSPDHGTADDLAGTGRADPGSMILALVLAARIVSNRETVTTRLADFEQVLEAEADQSSKRRSK